MNDKKIKAVNAEKMPVSSIFENIMMDGMALGIVILDNNFCVTGWNSWMENHTDIREKEILGKPLLEKFPDIRERKKDRYLQKCVENRMPVLLSPNIHHYFLPIDLFRNEKRIRMYQNVKIYPYPGGGAIIVIEDLTEQIVYEREIRLLNRMIRCIGHITGMMVKGESEEQLLTEACRILHEDACYMFAWIGWIEEDIMIPFCHCGEGHDIARKSGNALHRESNPNLLVSILSQNETLVVDWSIYRPEKMFRRPFHGKCRTSCYLPLSLENRQNWFLCVCSQERGGFRGKEKELLEEFAQELSCGYQTIRGRKKRFAAEESLKLSEEKMRRMIGFCPAGILSLTENRCDFANPALVKMLGYESSQTLEGCHIEQLILSDDIGRFAQVCHRKVNHEKPGYCELQMLKSNGDIFEAGVWASTVDAGTPRNVFCFLIDLNVEKQIREQLLNAQKQDAIGTLAAGIAHDLNNVLYPILGNAELVFDELPADSECRPDVREIIDLAKRASDLVERILSFSRPEKESIQSVSIHRIITETLKLIRATLPATIKIQKLIDIDCHNVLIDPTRVQQIFMNLCTNAFEAMKDTGGTLTVSVANHPVTDELQLDFETGDDSPLPLAWVRLTVSDTGSGICDKDLNSIFDPYYSTKGRENNSGLGLSIVQKIVKSHGGRIQVENKPGKGVCFKIDFIADLVAYPEKQIEDKKQFAGNFERILIVDDEISVLRMVKRNLQKIGYEIVTVNSPAEAISWFEKEAESVNLVISDYSMPEMTGISLSRKLREIDSTIPIVICTGYPGQITDEIKKELNIRCIIKKPVARDQLAETIHLILHPAIA